MTSKKTKPAPPEPADEKLEAADEKPAPLRVGTWAGHPNYECTRCGYKGLDREAALEHILTRHAIKEAAE